MTTKKQPGVGMRSQTRINQAVILPSVGVIFRNYNYKNNFEWVGPVSNAAEPVTRLVAGSVTLLTGSTHSSLVLSLFGGIRAVLLRCVTTSSWFLFPPCASHSGTSQRKNFTRIPRVSGFKKAVKNWWTQRFFEEKKNLKVRPESALSKQWVNGPHNCRSYRSFFTHSRRCRQGLIIQKKESGDSSRCRDLDREKWMIVENCCVLHLACIV